MLLKNVNLYPTKYIFIKKAYKLYRDLRVYKFLDKNIYFTIQFINIHIS
jgi:hypothetical protein